MAALGAHKSSQESAPTGFGALPRELQTRCVEALDLAEAASLVKQLSKGTRAAARRALTRGRWRPVCEVARNGKATIEGVMGGYWKIDGNPQAGASTWQERLAGLSDASRALFREAWALEYILECVGRMRDIRSRRPLFGRSGSRRRRAGPV